MSNNNIYNILGKLKGITDSAALTPDTQPKTVYESVEARGSITEAVKALEAKYKTFKESVADDIADKKAEKEAGDWWGDKKADSKKSREVKGDKYGGSKQKSDDEDDFKSKKTAILDKDDDEVLDESLNEYSQAEYDGAMSDFKKKGGTVQQLAAKKPRKAEKTDFGSKHIGGAGEIGKRGKAVGKSANSVASKPVVDVAEGLAFGDTVKNPAKLSKAPKAKLVKESSSRRNDPIYTNPKAWAHYEEEMNEEELNKATQELDEISKLAGLPKPAANTVPPIAPAPVADNNWNDEDDAWLDRQRDAADLQNDYNKENPIDEAEIATGNTVSIKGRGVNVDSIEIDGVDTSDYPDFSDAYITYAEFTDGTPLSEFELDELYNEHGDLVNQAAHDSLQGMSDGYDPYDLEESTGADFNKILNAIAALHGDEIWDNDAMQDLADELAQANPTDQELDYIIQNGDLPSRLANIQFSAGDNVQFNEAGVEEGNEFSGALAAAKASGIKDFEVAGKKYTVKEDINVNVTASGEEDALNLFRKLAGMPQIAIAQNEEPLEVEVDEERDPEYVNSPREQTAGIGAAIPSGNDLHGAKRAYKITQPGDNPMAVTESKKDTSWNKYTGMLKGLLK